MKPLTFQFYAVASIPKIFPYNSETKNCQTANPYALKMIESDLKGQIRKKAKGEKYLEYHYYLSVCSFLIHRESLYRYICIITVYVCTYIYINYQLTASFLLNLTQFNFIVAGFKLLHLATSIIRVLCNRAFLPLIMAKLIYVVISPSLPGIFVSYTLLK